MTLQLTLTQGGDGHVGKALLAVSDPAFEVDRIEFFSTVLPSGPRRGPFPANRMPAIGSFELDVLRDVSAQTKVEAVITKMDSTTALPTPEFITLDTRSATVPAPRLRSLDVYAQWWRIHVGVVPAAAFSWKCWVRRGSWPTMDSTETGALLDEYLTFEGHRDELNFSFLITPPEGQTYYIVAAGFNSSGAMGARTVTSVKSTYGPPIRTSLTPQVLQRDGIEQRSLTNEERLRQFTDWLIANNVNGFIGEFGWPHQPADWNAVASQFFGQLNANQLWACVWAVGDLWGSYNLAPYLYANGTYTPRIQADVLEVTANKTTANYKRGVNVAGAEFAAPVQETFTSFSNVNPGIHGQHYRWNGANTYQYMYDRGHRLVRVCFRWERMQPIPGGALDTAELGRMRTSVTAAVSAGLEVILDMHNYGAYWLHDAGRGGGVRTSIGTPACTIANFADAWRRLAEEFNGEAGVIGYGLMNEPVDMLGVDGMSPAETWAAAAQAATNAIRLLVLPPGAVAKWIMVSGYEWGATWSPDVNHPSAFITDTANKLRYEAHIYFDADSSGRYIAPELDPTMEGNWVRWDPNVALWKAASDGDDGETLYEVEVVRMSDGKVLDRVPLWKRGITDEPVSPCVAGAQGCSHRMYEYRVIARHRLDGSTQEFQTSINGPYQ